MENRSQTVLLMCDDEVRRAELHMLLAGEFEVYATGLASADKIRKKLRRKGVPVIEVGVDADLKTWIRPASKHKREVFKIIRSILSELKVKIEEVGDARKKFLNLHLFYPSSP